MTHLSEKLDDTHNKVEEMHAILLQAKGARWVIVGLAGVAAGIRVGGEDNAVVWSLAEVSLSSKLAAESATELDAATPSVAPFRLLLHGIQARIW